MAPSAYHHRAPEIGMEGVPNIPSQAAEEVGFEPTTERNTPGNRLAGGRTRPTMRLLQEYGPQNQTTRFGGGGGIRTHETFRPAGFQDQCDRPLCHPSVKK